MKKKALAQNLDSADFFGAKPRPPEYGFAFLDQFPETTQRYYLSRVLRGRRELYGIRVNGEMLMFPRATIRDYLRKKFPDVKAYSPPMMSRVVCRGRRAGLTRNAAGRM